MQRAADAATDIAKCFYRQERPTTSIDRAYAGSVDFDGKFLVVPEENLKRVSYSVARYHFTSGKCFVFVIFV